MGLLSLATWATYNDFWNRSTMNEESTMSQENTIPNLKLETFCFSNSHPSVPAGRHQWMLWLTPKSLLAWTLFWYPVFSVSCHPVRHNQLCSSSLPDSNLQQLLRDLSVWSTRLAQCPVARSQPAHLEKALPRWMLRCCWWYDQSKQLLCWQYD